MGERGVLDEWVYSTLLRVCFITALERRACFLYGVDISGHYGMLQILCPGTPKRMLGVNSTFVVLVRVYLLDV